MGNQKIQLEINVGLENIKGIVHPKKKILSSFTQSLFQTCINVFVLPNTKEDIWKNVSNQTSLIPHYLSEKNKSYGSKYSMRSVQLLTFIQISLCSAEQRIVIRFGAA